MNELSANILTEIGVTSPWINAPGFLGYLPPSKLDFPAEMGAFLPPPLSLISRNPAKTRTAIPFGGGVLLRTGLPNPGIAVAIRQYQQRWSRLELPLWLSLLPRDADEAREMSELVDELDCVVTFQILLPRGASMQERAEILSAAQGEKPFFVELPLDEVNRECVGVIQKSSASGIVISAPRGILLKDEQWVSGRLYGPALFPQAARIVRELVKAKISVIAGCGVCTIDQGESLLAMGTIAVQVDVALWV
jgi:dihydroorotate dehydrogenase